MATEPEDRRQPAADAHHLAAPLHGRDHARQRPKRFAHRERGDHIPLLAHPHEQSLDDRQRERHIERERSAAAFDRIDLDLAAHLFDIAADDVHPHAAAREIGHLLGSGESRSKNQLKDFAFVERFLRLDDSPFDRLGEDLLGAQAPAVVLDLDDDESALMEGPQCDRAGARLAGSHAGLRHLDAMVGRVADHMNQRIAQLFDNVAIELGVFPLEIQLDLFPLLEGQIADEPGHLLERVADRHHPQRHRRALQIGGDAAELAEAAGEMGAGDCFEFGVLHHHRLGDHQFPHQIDQAVKLERVDPHDAGANDGASRGGCGTAGSLPHWNRRLRRQFLDSHSSRLEGKLGLRGGSLWLMKHCRKRRLIKPSGARGRLGMRSLSGGRGGRGRGGRGWRTMGWGGLDSRRGCGHRLRSRGGCGWNGRSGAGQAFASQQGMHILDQLGDRQGNLPARLHAADLLRKLRHKSLEDVGAGQNHGDRIAAELIRATAGRIEHRFEFVRELLQHIELHHPDVALERVKRPEERIDRGGIGRIHFQHQHALLDVLQEILRLSAE